MHHPYVGPQVGETFAGYTIEAIVGRGGMGTVYLGRHRQLQRPAAIKVLAPELAEDEAFRTRFIRESQLAAALDHPNVIPIYHAAEEHGVPFIAMRFVEGGDLLRVLRKDGPLDLARTADIAAQAAAALDAAHAAALVHRDVKPANILLEEDGRVFLSDFGVAKRSSSVGLTRAGAFLGSVDYCSPEQIRGEAVDGRTDVYALGAVVFHCLAGGPPFRRDADVAVIHAHLSDPVPSLVALRPDLPEELDDLLATALAKSADERFLNAGAFANALRSAAGAGGPRARALPTRVDDRGASSPTVVLRGGDTDEALTRALEQAPQRRRIPLWAVGAALVALVLAGSGAAVLLLRPQTARDAGSSTGTGALSPSVTSRLAGRLRTLARAQESVNGQLDGLAGASSLAPLATAGRRLERAVLLAQGYRQQLVPHTHVERVELSAFDRALARHATFAELVAALPVAPADLTRNEAQAVVDAGDASSAAYVRLTGVASSLPLVPVDRERNAALLAVVPTPKPRPKPRPTPTPSGSTLLTTFTGSRFSIGYPSGWRVETSEAAKPGYFDTTIRDPGDPSVYLRVDYSLNASGSLDSLARPQEVSHSRLSGYDELEFANVTFAGYPAVRWEFVEPQGGTRAHSIDMFLLDDVSTGWAVLVHAPAAGYAARAPQLERILESFVVQE
jgi:serine/threonine-protein kinase